jgi:hypothetical protein
MLGLNDRMALREPVVEKPDSKPSDKKSDKKDAKAKPEAKPGEAKPGAKPGGAPDTAAKPEDKAVDTELSPDDAADNNDAPPAITPDKSARSPNGVYEFREERWVELYTRKIDEMIGVLKSKGVPVLWVGLPAIRGAKPTADMLFLDSLYREAGRQGRHHLCRCLGRICRRSRPLPAAGPGLRGPDRRLRSNDGVYFTKAGARKLAHYAEREITRLLAGRFAPIALPTEPATPDANALPGSRRRVRWPDRSCRWWHPRSAPINCSAARARARPRSIRSPRERWSRASRSRRPPAAPMILPGRAAKSDANRRRAKPPRHPYGPTPKQPRQRRRERRKKLVGTGPRNVEAAIYAAAAWVTI